MKNVYIWHGDGWGGNKLSWMYAPARKTLVEGFKNLVNEKYIDERVKFYKWDIIKPNSIFIWIGEYHAERVPWNQLKKKNIYTIYYQTEPWNENKRWNFNANEIWDYSLRNVYKIRKELIKKEKKPRKIRYVPPGYLLSKKLSQQKNSNIIFFGDTHWRPQYKAMKNKFRDKLIHIFNIWNQPDFDKYIIEKPKGSIFLNLHKHNKCLCAEGLRFSQLLSAGCLIISEKCDTLDENIFKDYVTFTNNCHKEYNNFIKMPLQDRQKKADNILEKYKKEFSPRSIFERAKINEII